MLEQASRRKYERIRFAGYVRIMIDAPDGLRTTSGHLVDLSEEGCAIHSQTHIEPNTAGRIQVQVGGVQLWLPIRTRWIRCDARRWIAGCYFDQPTEEKQRTVRALLWERRKLERY